MILFHLIKSRLSKKRARYKQLHLTSLWCTPTFQKRNSAKNIIPLMFIDIRLWIFKSAYFIIIDHAKIGLYRRQRRRPRMQTNQERIMPFSVVIRIIFFYNSMKNKKYSLSFYLNISKIFYNNFELYFNSIRLPCF